MSKGLDSAKSLIDYAGTLVQEGYTFAARYYFNASSFKDRLEAAEATHLSAQKVYLVSIWESGYPTSADYFTSGQGKSDGAHAAAQAKAAGQPKGSPIYFAADYDSTPSDIVSYATEFQTAVKAAGYLAGIYGNGVTCHLLKERGLVSYTWLSQSTGFQGYSAWKPHANIVQTAEFNWHGFDVDGDTASGDSGGWRV